jgi:hypothetical protein
MHGMPIFKGLSSGAAAPRLVVLGRFCLTHGPNR